MEPPSAASDTVSETVNVLLVEDEPAHEALIRRSLEGADPVFAIDVATNLADAREYLAHQTPDIALIDWVLPDGRGVELVSKDRHQALFPVVIMTSKGDEKLAVEAMKAGALDYVEKSVATLADLRRLVIRTRREWRHITERRRAVKDLHSADRRYRALVESASDAIFTTATDGKLQSLNRAFETITGFDRREWLGRPFLDMIHEDDRDLAASAMEDVSRGAMPPLLEIRIPSPANGCRTVEFRIQPAIARNEVVGAYGVGRDLTDRMELEMQLRQAQKMEAIGRLAGGLAHDFNNVLTVILGCTDLVLERFEGPDEDKGLMEDIRGAGWRAQRVIDQLLAFSRRQQASAQEMDLNQLVLAMEQMLRRLLGEDIELVTQRDPELGLVMADWGQVEQWLLNLAVNARDAMPHGGRLEIRTRGESVTPEHDLAFTHLTVGDYARLTVADTGVGIPDQIVDRIFEPFFTTKRPGVGTGLGLSTVHGMVKRAGGHLAVESADGKGTTFDVFLPLAVVSRAHEVRVEAVPKARGTETVLVVEDEDPVRRVAKRALESTGYTVLIAENGRAALDVIRSYEGKIDVLLTDVVMPGMNGRELADQVAVLRSDIKIMFMSGYASDTVAGFGVFGESANFVRKPFTPASLGRQVDEMLRHA